MDWKTFDADLGDIDIADGTYRITTDQSIAPLSASIGALGLLNPPFVVPTRERKYTIVSGFKRVAACRRLGWGRIRVRLLKPDLPLERLAEIAVGDNALQRPLNDVEKSRALNLISAHTPDRSSVEQMCRRLGLPHHSSLRNKIMQICRMPDGVQAEGVLVEGRHTGPIQPDFGQELLARHDGAVSAGSQGTVLSPAVVGLSLGVLGEAGDEPGEQVRQELRVFADEVALLVRVLGQVVEPARAGRDVDRFVQV